MRAGKLGNGVTRSCGCLQADAAREANTTHGLRRTRSYRVWAHMKNRCLNTKYPRYHLWGGRGVTVCAEWVDSFGAFFADMGECPEGMSIDRFPDQNGNYELSNCRWATPMQQANNLRTTRRLALGDEEMTISEWAAVWGCSRDAIKLRLRRGACFADVAAALQP